MRTNALLTTYEMSRAKTSCLMVRLVQFPWFSGVKYLTNVELSWGSGNWTKFAGCMSRSLLLKEWCDICVSPRRKQYVMREGGVDGVSNEVAQALRGNTEWIFG